MCFTISRMLSPEQSSCLALLENLTNLNLFLAYDFRVIGIDSHGHRKPTLEKEGLTYKLLQQDVEIIITQLRVSNVTIFGSNYRGFIAYRLAAGNSVIVDKFTTIGATWKVSDALYTEELFKKITPASWSHKPMNFTSRYLPHFIRQG